MGSRLGGQSHALTTQNSDTFSAKFSVFKILPVLQFLILNLQIFGTRLL